jgi:O-phospho-L-seryl-tRNASec:L-selenocysteinyl-tRNA synthase
MMMMLQKKKKKKKKKLIKAAGLAARLTRDAIRIAGACPATAHACAVMPCATGMTISLCLRACTQLPRQGPAPHDSDNDAGPRVVVMTRVDQKACVKAVSHAGLALVVVENALEGHELAVRGDAVRAAIDAAGGAARVAAVLSSASAFAPRVPDDLAAIAAVCEELGVPHIVNNAFGVQSTKALQSINDACARGRVDAFVQSTDKNFMVPVGGAVVVSPKVRRQGRGPQQRPGQQAGPGSDAAAPPQSSEAKPLPCGGSGGGATGGTERASDFVALVAKCYPGRASAAPVLDMTITLLSMGRATWTALLTDRKARYARALELLAGVAARHGVEVLDTRRNRVSIVLSLRNARTRLRPGVRDITEIGARLFSRAVTGVRVVDGVSHKEIDGHDFAAFGAHCDAYPFAPYLTFSCAIGMSDHDLEVGIKRLDAVLAECIETPEVVG